MVPTCDGLQAEVARQESARERQTLLDAHAVQLAAIEAECARVNQALEAADEGRRLIEAEHTGLKQEFEGLIAEVSRVVLALLVTRIRS